jgi:hypothetical protein
MLSYIRSAFGSPKDEVAKVVGADGEILETKAPPKLSVLSIAILFIITAFMPVIGLSAIAVYLLLVAPVIFGVIFVTGTLVLVLKSLALAVVVMTLASVWLAFKYLQSKLKTAP